MITAPLALSGCGTRPESVSEPPLSETLKQRISKARNAIEETRRAIARSRGTPYVMELRVRLGELLSDEARAHYQVARAREGVSDRTLHAPQVKTLKLKAVEVYKRAIRDFPTSPLVPRAMFNLGQELRELGELDEMRATFRRLAELAPNDPLTSEALLVLGSDAFDRGALDEAASLLERVMSGPEHRVKGSAYHRWAWVKVNQDNCKDAIKGFVSAIKVTQRWREGAGAEDVQRGLYSELDVRRNALSDMMFCYSKERKEKGAVARVTKLAYERGALVDALSKLSRRYALLERYKGLRDASRALLDLAPGGDARLEDAQHLHTALKRLKEYSAVGDDVERVCATLRREATRPGLNEAERAQLVSEYEQYARDLAVSALEALYGGKGAKTGDTPTPLTPSDRSAQVTRAHLAYLNTFKVGALGRGEGRLDMMANLIGLYASLEMNLEAGRLAYERTFELEAEGGKGTEPSERAEAIRADAYEAVSRLQLALSSTDLDAAQRVIARAALRRSAGLLLSGELDEEQARKVRFAIAQTFYEEGRLNEATTYLTAVALSHPKTEQGDTAALMTLDAYQQANDLLGLARSGERFLKIGVSAELRGRVQGLVAAAREQQVDELALEASGLDGGDPTEELLSFASDNPNTPLGERALLNAFVAARGAGDLPGMRKVAQLVSGQYPKSKQLGGVWSSLARSAAAQLDLKGALSSYDRAAQLVPEQRVSLIGAAAELKAKLGDVSGALKDLEGVLTPELVSAGSPPARAALGLYARLTVDHKAPSAAWSSLSSWKERLESPPAELQVVLGYLLALRKDFDAAEEYAQVAADSAELPSALKGMGLYAMAEVYGNMLKEFTPGDNVDELGEWVTLLDLAQQSYLKVARLGDPLWGAAALSRLAHLSAEAGTRVASFKAPAALAGPLKIKGEALKKQSEQALKACQELAWRRGLFTPPVRLCLQGQLMTSPEVPREPLMARSQEAPPTLAAEERALVANNPQDYKALKALGEALLKAKDPHLARLALAQGLQGGGPELANLYGVACAEVQDWSGALEGFGRAGIAGLEAGVLNTQKLLQKLSLTKASAEVREQWKVSVEGGARW